jgi:hypothetical protein
LRRSWGQWQFIKGKRFFTILVKKDRFRTFLLVFFLFSIYIFVFSESGILERNRLKNKFDLLDNRIALLKQESSELQKQYEKYSASQYSDIDIVRSGYIDNRAEILIFKNSDREESDGEFFIPGDILNFNLNHLRIIWIIISSMIIIIYFTKYRTGDEFSDG